MFNSKGVERTLNLSFYNSSPTYSIVRAVLSLLSSITTYTFSANTLTETLFIPGLLDRLLVIFFAQFVQLIPPTYTSYSLFLF